MKTEDRIKLMFHQFGIDVKVKKHRKRRQEGKGEQQKK
jgi:hypothetical protein